MLFLAKKLLEVVQIYTLKTILQIFFSDIAIFLLKNNGLLTREK